MNQRTVGFCAAAWQETAGRRVDGAPPPSAPRLVKPEGVIERESTCDAYRESGDIRRAVEFIRRHTGMPPSEFRKRAQLAESTA